MIKSLRKITSRIRIGGARPGSGRGEEEISPRATGGGPRCRSHATWVAGLLLAACALSWTGPATAAGPAELPPLGFQPLPREVAIGLEQPVGGGSGFRALPGALDWRDAGIITPPKAQLDCGGCWAFAGIACLEAMSVSAGADPGLDLSEQFPLSCDTQFRPMYGVGNEGCCGGTVTVFEFLKEYDAIPEPAFPYDNGDYDGSGPRDCAASPTWNTIPCPSPHPPSSVWRVQSWSLIAPQPVPGTEQITAALQDGPVWLGFYVYEDFIDYWFFNPDPAIPYRHTSGTNLGGHAVLAIGYNDIGHYWIVKNSWGTTGPFGDGTFRVDYSDNCDFGLNAAKITVEEQETPARTASLGNIRALFR